MDNIDEQEIKKVIVFEQDNIPVESQRCDSDHSKVVLKNEQPLRGSNDSVNLYNQSQNERKVTDFHTDYNRRFTCGSSQLDVKPELQYNWKQCLLCDDRSDQTYNIYTDMTSYGHVTLISYISKMANVSLENRSLASKFACHTCYNLLNVIEHAELEYVKHRAVFLEIIKNSIFNYDICLDNDCQNEIKAEIFKRENDSSDDNEPLSTIKPSVREPEIKTDDKESTPDNRRHFSSDEDFCWTLDIKENVDKADTKIKIKKRKLKRRKKVRVKEENSENDPSEMLEVQLKEEVDEDEAWVAKEKKTKGKSSKSKLKENGITSKENVDKSDLVCNKCDRSFKSQAHWNQHMAKHEHDSLPFICEVCGKGFKNRKMCDVHVLMHKGISDYKCIPCNKLFPTKFAFLRHDKIHKGTPKHQCEQCGKSFIHTSSFRMHKLAHSGIKKHSCDVCGLALISSSHLSRHKRIHSGEKRFECDSCGKKFSEKYNMQSHMKTHLKGKDLFALESIIAQTTSSPQNGRPKRWFKCERCDEKFDRLFKLEIHLVDDHKVVLKKGRPKPRNTMKKLQRAQQAAANMVNAIANAIGAKKAARIAALAEASADVKPSVSSLDEKIKELTSNCGSELKKSPGHASVSPRAVYMSPVPTETNAGESSRQYHHPHMIRAASTMWPHMAYNVPMSYLSRMPDYAHNN